MDDPVSLREFLLGEVAALRTEMQGNDRRYTEVSLEKEKALLMLAEAAKDALKLARDQIAEKTEAHNGLLRQMAERDSTYALKSELASQQEKTDAKYGPVITWMANQQGGSKWLSAAWAVAIVVIGLAFTYFNSTKK